MWRDVCYPVLQKGPSTGCFHFLIYLVSRRVHSARPCSTGPQAQMRQNRDSSEDCSAVYACGQRGLIILAGCSALYALSRPVAAYHHPLPAVYLAFMLFAAVVVFLLAAAFNFFSCAVVLRMRSACFEMVACCLKICWRFLSMSL